MDLLPDKEPSTNEAPHLTLKHLPLPGPGEITDLENECDGSGIPYECDGATTADSHPVRFSVAGSYKVCYKVAGAGEYQQVSNTLLTVSSSSSGSVNANSDSVDPNPPTSYTTNVKPRFGSMTLFTLSGGD